VKLLCPISFISTMLAMFAWPTGWRSCVGAYECSGEGKPSRRTKLPKLYWTARTEMRCFLSDRKERGSSRPYQILPRADVSRLQKTSCAVAFPPPPFAANLFLAVAVFLRPDVNGVAIQRAHLRDSQSGAKNRLIKDAIREDWICTERDRETTPSDRLGFVVLSTSCKMLSGFPSLG